MEAPMEAKDIITLTISGGALAVSLISLYFSLFHKRFSLIGTLAAWNPRTENFESSQACEIAISNTGNRELVLREIEILSFPEIEGELFPILKSEQVPTVLKPGEMKLLTFPIADLYLQKLAKENRMLRLNFHIFTAEATLKLATKNLTPPVGGADIPESDWKPFKLQ